MDVYDLAEWSCLGPLTENQIIIQHQLRFQILLCGGWQKLKGLEFSIKSIARESLLLKQNQKS
jgi:hypothetical protein